MITIIGNNTEAKVTYKVIPYEPETQYSPKVERDIEIDEVLILGDNIKDDLSAEKLDSIKMECWEGCK